MAYEPGGVGTLAELSEFYRSLKIDTTTIELMNQINDILSDVPFREANSIKGHETRVRTGLPDVYFRRLYRGTPLSRSQYSRVVEGIGMLEARMELDVKEKELYGATFNAYRLQEGKAFMEALRQKAAELFFYGDHNVLADEFDGFFRFVRLFRFVRFFGFVRLFRFVRFFGFTRFFGLTRFFRFIRFFGLTPFS